MFLRMIYDDRLAQAAYLIGCQRTGEAIVIDPERDVDRYMHLAAKEGLRLVAAAETHIHADFLSGARELAESAGATVYLSAEGGPDWQYQWLDRKRGGGSYRHRLLKNGDTFRVGGIEFRALHTPGHTPEHVCYLVTDTGGGATEPMGIASGDFLFVGDLGRPDLLETAAGQAGASAGAAHQLFHSTKLLGPLADWLQVWPAHGAGSACGKALGAVPQSTLGYERRHNATLAAAADEGGFVRFILEGQPEPPLYFARMKHDNKAGPRVLGTLPEPREMAAQEAAALDGRRVAIVDTRPWDAFRKEHVAGALFHPLDKAFSTDAGSMIREEETIYLIVEPGRVEEAVRDLVRIGLDNVAGCYDARNVAELARCGARMETTPEISTAEARKRVASGEVFVLDVRRAVEHAASAIPGSANIAHTRLDARLAEVPRDRPLLVHCRSGGRSARACALLQKHGYTVSNLAGGMLAWEREGSG